MFTFHFYEIKKMKVVEIDEKVAPTLDKAREMAIFVAKNDDFPATPSDIKYILVPFDEVGMKNPEELVDLNG